MWAIGSDKLCCDWERIGLVELIVWIGHWMIGLLEAIQLLRWPGTFGEKIFGELVELMNLDCGKSAGGKLQNG